MCEFGRGALVGKFAGFPKLSGTVAKHKLAGITIPFSSARGQSSSQEALFGKLL